MKAKLTRREAIRKVAGTTAFVAATGGRGMDAVAADEALREGFKGRIRQSVCRWCYASISLDDLCRAGKEMGLVAIDLLEPSDFETVRKHGMVCSMVSNPLIDGLGGIPKGWNRPEHHDKLVVAYEERIRQTADAGFERLICFSGNRAGLEDERGLEHCAIGLERIIPFAEKYRVTLCMELLNSKRDHKDYQCDHSRWGVELVKRISSDRFKLLYDIFHMQIMEGDVCSTIQENHSCFDHYHTGGVPGRGEIDGTQELNYARIMQAIAETEFKGYVAQEFVPKRPDAMGSLREAVRICDV